MFSRTTASHFFTLFCLWVNVLSINASPLPYENRRSPPVQFGPSLPPPRLIRDLQILTFYIDQPREHSTLLIGTTGVHALTEDGHVSLTSILTPQKMPEEFTAANLTGLEETGHRVTSLGTASFRDAAEEQEAIDQILQVKLPQYAQGGNCRDFIRLALKILIRKKNVIREEVFPRFEKFYEERMPVIQKHHDEKKRTRQVPL
ncbi:hypothetical protein EV368DRAFT_85485 [Lentinula lateritia]|nr:hypothetical protein EV368DRAFT_85485 [Lentinula lateritia]